MSFLSIVIPAYNEERRLPPTLEKVSAFLRTQPYQSEVIVIENGSTDATSETVTRFMAEHILPEDPFTLTLLHSAPGKGAAVKVGMLAAHGKYLFVCDADLAMPIDEIVRFLPSEGERDSFDVAIGSREVAGAIRYGEPTYRHIMGRVFNFVVHLLAVPGIEDTQCGFKMFTREAAQLIFPLQHLDGWSFDVEVLYIARKHKLRLIEIPIRWHYQDDSRVRPARDTIDMVCELIKIRHNNRLGLYHRSLALPECVKYFETDFVMNLV